MSCTYMAQESIRELGQDVNIEFDASSSVSPLSGISPCITVALFSQNTADSSRKSTSLLPECIPALYSA